MKNPTSFLAAVLVGLFVLAGNARIHAQVSPSRQPGTIRGKITAVNAAELSVAAANGEVRATVPDKTVIRQEIAMQLSDIAPGMYLGTTAEKQADGTFRASEVHVFSEDQRGTGEGHRPSSSVPNSTMTNASVEKVEDVVVQDVKGRVMSLKFSDGEIKVFVPPGIPLVKRVVASRDALKPGAEVSLQGTPGPDGTVIASQITIRASK
ncbi:MAG TPA: DUF5666 domain-containing protein [Candidatus Binatia bacterium]|jgi:hypothetical protein